jgi:hypothetical protein
VFSNSKLKEIEMRHHEKPSIIMKASDFLEKVGKVSLDNASIVKLSFIDGVCFIQTFDTSGKLLKESDKVPVLGSSFDADGVYIYSAEIFKEIIEAYQTEHREYNNHITAMMFDPINKKTELITMQDRIVIDCYNKLNKNN